MLGFNTIHVDASDKVSVGLGFVMSMALSTSFLQFAQEGTFALLFGGFGALGGWLVNRFIIKPIEKKFFPKKEGEK